MPAAAPLLLVGALAAARAAAAPPTDTSWYGRASHPSPAWRSVAAFGAVGDGVHDDTRAIQAALDAARGDSGAKAPAVVYVPPGDYLISDTLRVWGFTTLRGCSTSPPTLRLAPAAPGFGNVSALRPLLASTSGWGVNLTAGLPPWWHNTLPSNFLFYQQVHALSLDVSAAGNDGAVALYWCVAQQTSVRDVRITVGGAFSGIDMCQLPGYAPAPGGGSGGGGSIEDVSVSGGAYGIRGMASQYAFRGLRLAGARVAALALLDFVWTFAFVDVAIADTPAALVTRGLGDRHSTLVALVDAVLANITGPAALVLGGAGTPTFLQNVTLRGSAACTAVVANATSAGALDAVWLAADGGGGGGGGATLVERWVGWLDDGAPGVGNFVGGARSPESRTALPGAPRAPLASLARPWLDDLAAPPCNAVTDCGARGDGASDDTAALQRCLDACEAVYLPFGVFLVTDTLNLSARTALTGEMLSNIRLAPHAPGFGAAGAPRALLDTPDDAAARVRITDVSLGAGAGNAGAVLLRWRAGGAGSGLWDVNVNISTPVARGVHAAGHGARLLQRAHLGRGPLVGDQRADPRRARGRRLPRRVGRPAHHVRAHQRAPRRRHGARHGRRAKLCARHHADRGVPVPDQQLQLVQHGARAGRRRRRQRDAVRRADLQLVEARRGAARGRVGRRRQRLDHRRQGRRQRRGPGAPAVHARPRHARHARRQPVLRRAGGH